MDLFSGQAANPQSPTSEPCHTERLHWLGLLQGTLDALADHIAVLDSQANIIAVNLAWRTFAATNDLKSQNFGLGANYLSICDAAQGDQSRDARSVAEQLRRLLIEGGGEFRQEYSCHGPGLRRWFQLRVSCFRFESGLYCVLAHQCISAVKEAEQEVRESEERYRALVQHAPDAIIVHQGEMVVFANPAAARLHGVARGEDLMGRTVSSLVSPADRESVQGQLVEVLDGAVAPPIEGWAQRADGVLVPIEARSVAVSWHGQRAVQLIARDITERKRVQDGLVQSRIELEKLIMERTGKLQEIVAELEHFSYALTHDLRAPLRAIMAFVELLRRQCQGCQRPIAMDYLRRTEQAAERMDNLVRDALNYSRILRQDVALRPVALGPLISGLIEVYPELHRHRARIDLVKPLPVVLGNEAALTECFSNLLRNAVTFVRVGRSPRVQVRAQPLDQRVRIWVEDNGIGIPQDAHERIFEMFQRLHDSSVYPGTGIGLAIVRKALERMKGRVGVESLPGKGSRFWIELQEVPNEQNDNPPNRGRGQRCCPSGLRVSERRRYSARPGRARWAAGD